MNIMINIEKIKKAFAAEKLKVKNKKLLFISLFTPLISVLMLFIAIESYNNIQNMLSGFTKINDFLFLTIATYAGVAQPIYLVLVCYFIFNQKNNSDLNNSVIPNYYINYSRILLVIKYITYNLLFLLGYILVYLLILLLTTNVQLSFDFDKLPHFLLTLVLFPVLTLPFISFLNILSKWVSSLYISLFIMLPILYFLNYNTIIIFKTNVFSFFNLQLELIQELGAESSMSNNDIIWLICTNLIAVALFLFFISRNHNHRVV
ncbi:MAG: hypothetical protein R2863_04440 [Candidatus Kapaibacterium sp.]|nr:hypothetical protein [Ignavibacteriota bacterium]